jgi:hypothetical protein
MSAVVIGLLASVAILFQLQGAFLGFGWALIHGAGVVSLVAFVPSVIALGILWVGYFFLRRMGIRRERLVFAGYALGLLAVIELFVPGTPLKTAAQEAAIAAVEIRNLRDEPVLSEAGHPIAIRIAFEVVFPRTGQYLVGPSVLMPAVDGLPYNFQFGHFPMPTIVPPPRDVEGPYDEFQRGTVYTITADARPNFRGEDDRTHVRCLNLVADAKEAEFIAALPRGRALKYRGEVHIEGPTYVLRTEAAKEFVTREYDVEAIYRGLIAAGSKRCW